MAGYPPLYYAYEMRFAIDGERRRLRGLLCAMDLEPWGGDVLPHEETMPGPSEDRLRLLRATHTHLSPIYGTMSTDHGLTWSTPEEISGTSPTLCFFGNFFTPGLDPHKCNFDQGSYPVALPDGSLEVIFNNGNTPAGNPNGGWLSAL